MQGAVEMVGGERERVCLHARQREGQRERGKEGEEGEVRVCVCVCFIAFFYVPFYKFLFYISVIY